MINKTYEVWSNGGGVQSIAIAALIIQGKLPKPDMAFIIDTTREKSSTFEYMNQYVVPALDKLGIYMWIADKNKYSNIDLWSGSDKDTLVIPAYKLIENKPTKMSNFCSGEWKIQVANRFIREKGINKCNLWLGISRDEMKRIRISKLKWLTYKYPLIDLKMSRNDCVKEIEAIGWPLPNKSSCWMCPNQTISELVQLKRDYSKDWEKAVNLEKEIQEKDKNIFLNQKCISLDELDLSIDLSIEEDKACTSGFCYY